MGEQPLNYTFFRIPSVKVPGHKGADGYPLNGMIPQMYNVHIMYYMQQFTLLYTWDFD